MELEERRTGLVVLGIVAIVAIIGLVILLTEKQKEASLTAGVTSFEGGEGKPKVCIWVENLAKQDLDLLTIKIMRDSAELILGKQHLITQLLDYLMLLLERKREGGGVGVQPLPSISGAVGGDFHLCIKQG